jgi:hypothetical protein
VPRRVPIPSGIVLRRASLENLSGADGTRSRSQPDVSEQQRTSTHVTAVEVRADAGTDVANLADAGEAIEAIDRFDQPNDPIEAALAEAITKASAAGAWDAVAALTAELLARREAKAGPAVVSLEGARRRRKR